MQLPCALTFPDWSQQSVYGNGISVELQARKEGEVFLPFLFEEGQKKIIQLASHHLLVQMTFFSQISSLFRLSRCYKLKELA